VIAETPINLHTHFLLKALFGEPVRG